MSDDPRPLGGRKLRGNSVGKWKPLGKKSRGKREFPKDPPTVPDVEEIS